MRLLAHLFATILASAALAPLGGAQPTAWVPVEGPHAAGLRTAAVGSDGTLLAGTWVTVLRNAGTGWSEVAGAVNGSIHDISTAAGGRVWAGTSGVLRSDNGGQTWQWFSIRTAPHSGINPTIVHVAQSPAGVVFAGAFRSTDGGATWPDMDIYAFATAFVGSAVYAAGQSGIHRSDNGGASWVPSGLEGASVRHLAATGTRLVAATGTALYGSDDGASWTLFCSPAGVEGLAAAGDGTVWIATAGGLLRSAGGAECPAQPAAFAGQRVDDVAATGPTMLAVVEGNPFRSTDGGATWTAVRDGLGLPSASAMMVADGALAVATAGAGPFRSDDLGATWEPWPIGPGLVGVRRLVHHPAGDFVFAVLPSGIHRAALAGGPWTEMALPPDGQLEDAATDGSTLLVASSDAGLGQTIYRSADAGETWTVARTDADVFGPRLAAGGGVAAVSAVGFVSPALHFTNDGGQTWVSRPHPTAPAFGGAPALFADPAGRIYVADGNRLQRSADMGATWEPLGPAGATSNRIGALHQDADALCLGTLHGVWCSLDDGATFSHAGAGLPSGGSVDVVAVARDGERYVALTGEEGIFVSDAVTAGTPRPAGADGLAIAVAPSPAAGPARASVVLDAPAQASVRLFDTLGRHVATLHEGHMSAGVHALPFPTDGLAPGIYVIRLVAGERTATAPVSIAR